jgi:hypothetical protein
VVSSKMCTHGGRTPRDWEDLQQGDVPSSVCHLNEKYQLAVGKSVLFFLIKKKMAHNAAGRTTQRLARKELPGITLLCQKRKRRRSAR